MMHKMQVTHDPANGQYGDCFRACLSSLLGYEDPLDVPHFFGEYNDDDSELMWESVDQWLYDKHKLKHISIPWQFDSLDKLFEYTTVIVGDLAFMLLGSSPRANHVVICRNGEIIHDPSPLGKPPHLIGPAEDGYWWTEFLVHKSEV